MVVGKVGCHQNLVTELQRQKCIFLPTTLTQPVATISEVRGILRIKIKQTCSIDDRGSSMQPLYAIYVHAEGKCDVP